jgi:hypothetical protein
LAVPLLYQVNVTFSGACRVKPIRCGATRPGALARAAKDLAGCR